MGAAINVYANRHRERPTGLIDKLSSNHRYVYISYQMTSTILEDLFKTVLFHESGEMLYLLVLFYDLTELLIFFYFHGETEKS